MIPAVEQLAMRNPFNTPMTEPEAKLWEEQRAMGMRRYVWRVGVLCVGLPLIVLIVIINTIRYALQPEFFDEAVVSHIMHLALVHLWTVVFGTIGGTLLGLLVWTLMERRYHATSAGSK